jgi:hypothetical protein
MAAANELPISLGQAGVTGALTVDPSPALSELDRGAAAGYLMLMGFLGRTVPEDMVKEIHDHAAQRTEERAKRFGPSAVYFLVEARGEIATTPTDNVRDLGAVMLAFDAVDKRALAAQYHALVSAALTAVSLGMDTTPDIAPVSEGVALTLEDGRPLYSVTIIGGNASLTVARPATDQDALKIQHRLTGLLQNARLASPSRLLINALRSSGDRLEAFILGWAALEMVIRKCTIRCETGDWLKGVTENHRDAAAALHQSHVDGGHQQYSLAQKARVFALCHGLGTGDELAGEITAIRRGYREPLYHEGMVAAQLPVEAVVALARKVLQAALT